MIVEPAPAKLNLALHVRRRRADGYHDIETLFAFCTDGDVVSVGPSTADNFGVSGPYASALGQPHPSGATRLPPSPSWEREGARSPKASGRGEDNVDANLVVRAAQAFAQTFVIHQPHAITLDKRLPIAAGLGGGSADAAATLRALARLHGVALNDPRLLTLAASLGADVPACLLGLTAFGSGRGDALTPLDGLAGTPVLLVNPGAAVPTGPVYAGWDGIDRGPIGQGTLLDRARAGRNDLHAPALAIAPVIADVLALLNAPGVTLARMSGSGATCFALFESTPARAALAVAARARGWWVLETALA